MKIKKNNLPVFSKHERGVAGHTFLKIKRFISLSFYVHFQLLCHISWNYRILDMTLSCILIHKIPHLPCDAWIHCDHWVTPPSPPVTVLGPISLLRRMLKFEIPLIWWLKTTVLTIRLPKYQPFYFKKVWGSWFKQIFWNDILA